MFFLTCGVRTRCPYESESSLLYATDNVPRTALALKIIVVGENPSLYVLDGCDGSTDDFESSGSGSEPLSSAIFYA